MVRPRMDGVCAVVLPEAVAAMTDHADTIRRALRQLPASPDNRGLAHAALDALLAERQQAQEERDAAVKQTWAAYGIRDEVGKKLVDCQAERQQTIEALQRIVAITTPQPPATFQRIAREALANLGEQP